MLYIPLIMTLKFQSKIVSSIIMHFYHLLSSTFLRNWWPTFFIGIVFAAQGSQVHMQGFVLFFF